MDEIEKSGNDLDCPVEKEPLLNDVFGPLVRQKDPKQNRKEDPIFSFH